jgi:hypothetical protein
MSSTIGFFRHWVFFSSFFNIRGDIIVSLLEVTKTAFMGLKEGMPIASEVRTSVSGKCFFEIPHEIMVGFFSVSSFNSDEVSLFFEPGHNPLDCPLRPAEVG